MDPCKTRQGKDAIMGLPSQARNKPKVSANVMAIAGPLHRIETNKKQNPILQVAQDLHVIRYEKPRTIKSPREDDGR